MASSTRRYVDLDFGFHANPVTDDVSKKVDEKDNRIFSLKLNFSMIV